MDEGGKREKNAIIRDLKKTIKRLTADNEKLKLESEQLFQANIKLQQESMDNRDSATFWKKECTELERRYEQLKQTNKKMDEQLRESKGTCKHAK